MIPKFGYLTPVGPLIKAFLSNKTNIINLIPTRSAEWSNIPFSTQIFSSPLSQAQGEELANSSDNLSTHFTLKSECSASNSSGFSICRFLKTHSNNSSLFQAVETDEQSTELAALTLVDGFESTSLSTVTVPSNSPSVSPFYSPSEWNRPPIPGPLWRMSSADASTGMLFETSDGLVSQSQYQIIRDSILN